MPEIPPTPDISSVVDKIVPLIVQMGLVGMMVMGLILWIIGQRMVKTACIFAGLIMGGLISFFVCQQVYNGSAVMVWVIGGAVGGAVSAVFFFRLWMGVILALLLGLAIPSAVLVWQGHATTITSDNIKTVLSDTQTEESENAANGNVISSFQESARRLYEKQREFVVTWWQGLGATGRVVLTGCAIIGACAGMIMGLISPQKAAAVAAAFTGAVMMVIAGNGLLANISAEHAQWLRESPRGLIVVTSLITILGVIWQWMIFTRSADK